MKYRQLRKIDTGEWLDVLFTVQGSEFSVKPDSHQTDIAKGLGLLPGALEVVDTDTEVRVGPLLPLPVTPPPPNDDDRLVAAINAATTLAELKAALVGGQVRVKAKRE